MLHENGSFSVFEYDSTGAITSTQTYNVGAGLTEPLLAGMIVVKKGVIVGSNSSSKELVVLSFEVGTEHHIFYSELPLTTASTF
jgi:hypothetical protein